MANQNSGCSTFLKAIACTTTSFELTEDTHINYQGLSPQDIARHFRGEVVYNAETDIHFPHLTVGQTLKFAALARTPENRLPGVTRDHWAEHVRDVVMAAFGLLGTMDTKVGNDFLTGVSGGERKRVSIAEVVLSYSPLQCWDNSTRGLDSATALDFVKAVKMGADLNDAAVFVSLYQAAQDAYDLFEKVTLLYEGRQIYFGPTEKAKQFFEDMGYEPADERQTTPDFLTSLTAPRERHIKPGYEGKVPHTAAQFEAYWHNSPDFQALIAEIDEFNTEFPLNGPSAEAFKLSRAKEQAKLARAASPYNLSYPMQVSLCVKRGFQRLKGELDLPLTTIIGNTILAFIFASVFYNTPSTTDSFFARAVLIFFSVLFNALTASVEILSLYSQRPIVEKHGRYAFYHPSAEAVSSFIVDLPCKVLAALGFNVVLYFLANLRREASAFFTFFLFAFLCTLVMSSIFRAMSCVTKSLSEAATPASMLIIVLVATTGFVIPPVDIPPWIKWLSYLNPLNYAFEAMMINEFRNRTFTCSSFVPAGPGYETAAGLTRSCTAVGAVAGQNTVEGNDYLWAAYHYKPSHLWRNLGIVLAFLVAFSAAYIYAAETFKGYQSKGEVLVFPRGHKQLDNTPDDEETALQEATDLDSSSANDTKANRVSELQLSKGVFQWRNVCYDIPVKGGTKRLLNNVDGWIKPGTLTALMGASGAGKTTLLDVLANRATIGVITGEMLVNGHQRDHSFQRKTGYVQQQDVHLATSTVREALTFSALLRQPNKYTKQEKLEYVDEVIRVLDMEDYADATIGVPGEGLNIEQRKRLTIAVELAARPELLVLLDEPTSGLDSQTAWSICALMRKLATTAGQAVLCTVHQPSALLFHQFDRLLLLKPGGETVYFGEIGERARNVIGYFEGNGAEPCPEKANPAEWMLRVINSAPGSSPAAEVAGTETETTWFQVWRASPEYATLHAELDAIAADQQAKAHLIHISTTDDSALSDTSAHYAAPLLTQIQLVSTRVFTQLWRTPTYIYSKLLLCALTPFFVGIVFWQTKPTIQGMQNQMFSIFTVMIVFGPMIEQMMPHFVAQRTVFETREQPAKTYSWLAFMLSNIIAELPYQTLMSVLCFCCYYFPVGFEGGASRAGLFFAVMFAFFMFASTFGHLLIAAIDEPDTGGSLANLLFILCLIFCGILAPPSTLPGFWIFMYRVSPLTYIVGSFMSAGLTGLNITCAPREIIHLQPPSGSTCGAYLSSFASAAQGTILNPAALADCQYCPVSTSQHFLDTIRADLSEGWRNFGLVFVYVIFNVAAALAIFYFLRMPKAPRVKTVQPKETDSI